MTAINPQVARILANTALTPEQKREQIRQVHKPKIELTRKVPAAHIDTMMAEGGITPAQAYQLKQQYGTAQGDKALAEAMAAQTGKGGAPMMIARPPDKTHDAIDQAAALYGISPEQVEAMKYAPPEEQKRALAEYSQGRVPTIKESAQPAAAPNPAEGTVYAPDPRAGRGAAPAQIRNPAAAAVAQMRQQRRKFARQMAGYEEDLKKANAMQADAVGMIGQAKLEHAREREQILAEAAADDRAMAADRAKQEERRGQALAAAQAELNDVITDFRTKRIDPTRLYSKRRRVQVANAIGTAFGSLAQGKFAAAGIAMGNPVEATAQRNVAMIEKQIDQDIEAQKSEIEKLRTVAGFKQNGLQLMRQRFSDERAAESALRVAMWDDVENRLKVMAARSDTPQIQADTMRQLAEVDKKKVDESMKLAQIVDARTQQSLAAEGQTAAAGQKAQAAMMKATVDAQGLAPPPGVVWIDPKYANARNLAKVQEVDAKYAPAIAALKDVKEWRAKHSATLNPKAQEDGRNKLLHLKGTLTKLADAGASLTPLEADLAWMGLPEAIDNFGHVMQTVENIEGFLNRDRRLKMRSYGGAPATMGRDRGAAPVD